MKPASQFRNIHLFGQEERQINRISSPKEFSTETKSFTTVLNKKPDLGGSGFNANDGRDVVPPIIAYPELNASGAPSCSETAMGHRFIKCIDGPLTDYIANTNHHAFVLLFIVAKRARRIANHPDGLGIGEALIGDWEACGFSRQEYRTALKFLCQQNILTILETNRTRKKSTTGVTTAGTRVRLLNSEVWDINLSIDNHRPNHCPTTAQPLPNHEEERIRKNKKEKDNTKRAAKAAVGVVFEKSEKIKIRDTIELTQEEIDKAKAKHGDALFEAMCDILDAYKTSSGKTYKDDYGCFKAGSWVITRAKESLESPQGTPQAAAPVNAKPKTLGDVLAFAALGSYSYTAKFGVFELLSSQGYVMFSKSMTDLEGIEAELKARRLWKT